MADRCPKVDKCELFPRFKLETALGFCLETYCHADYESCARYRYAQENKAKPPSDLLPNGRKLPVVR